MEYILITGGLGYIGSHIAAELLGKGYNVVIVDNCSNSDLSTFDQIRVAVTRSDALLFYGADIRKGEELAAIFMAHRIAAVIHLAGSRQAGAQPLHYFSNNVSGTITLLHAMKHFRCRRLIYGSSASVYGNTLNPVSETSKIHFDFLTSQGQSIWMVEKILQEQVAADPDWSICILRLFNVCGSQGLKPNTDSIIYKLGLGQPISIYGSEHATPDGTCVRDYVHIGDVAAAFSAALYKVPKGLHIYNIGSGVGISMLELIACYEKTNNTRIVWRFEETRASDIPALYACIRKAAAELDWRPTRTIINICSFV